MLVAFHFCAKIQLLFPVMTIAWYSVLFLKHSLLQMSHIHRNIGVEDNMFFGWMFIFNHVQLQTLVPCHSR